MAFQIASDEATFIDSVRLLQVSHFDGAICKWGMPEGGTSADVSVETPLLSLWRLSLLVPDEPGRRVSCSPHHQEVFMKVHLQ